MAAPVLAQKSTADGIAEYREMLQDGNPAELFEMKGEELWKQKRGPRRRRWSSAIWARGRAWSRAPL
jgi:sulfur-oxidizing protein SoxA